MGWRLTSTMVAMAVAAGLLTGCASRGGSIPYGVQNFNAPDAPTAIPADAAYKIAPLDTVSVTVFQVPDLSHDYQIDLSGKLTMPLIGSVDAVGITPAELSDKLKHDLAAKYLQDPNVVVAVKSSVRQVVTVDGSVNQPGTFPAFGPMTLLQAVALAHGTDQVANPRRVAVFRMTGGKRMAAAFDLTSIRRGEMADPTIYAGDTVVVDGSRLRRAQRDLLSTLPLAAVFMAL